MNLLRHLRLQIPAAAFSRYGPLVEQIIADVLDARRNNVFARLAAGPPPAPPGSYELRDGQIYRWTA